MTAWMPIKFAPQGVTLLCRNGASWYFAGYIHDHWQRFDGRTVQPELWLEVAP